MQSFTNQSSFIALLPLDLGVIVEPLFEHTRVSGSKTSRKEVPSVTGLTAFLPISKCTVSLGGVAADLPRVSPMGSMAVVTAGGLQKLPRGRKQISR